MRAIELLGHGNRGDASSLYIEALWQTPRNDEVACQHLSVRWGNVKGGDHRSSFLADIRLRPALKERGASGKMTLISGSPFTESNVKLSRHLPISRGPSAGSPRYEPDTVRARLPDHKSSEFGTGTLAMRTAVSYTARSSLQDTCFRVLLLRVMYTVYKCSSQRVRERSHRILKFLTPGPSMPPRARK
jgi:hypothetical protein